MSTRWLFRALAVVLLAGLLTACATSGSYADDGGNQSGTSTSEEVVERYNNLYDSRGNHIDSYMYLSLYDGGTTGWTVRYYSWIASMAWTLYANVVKMSILWLDWIQTLGWKGFLLGPLGGLSNTVQTVMATLGLRPLMLALLAVVVVWLMFRRKTGTAVTELAVGCVIAALAVGALANPMAVVAGENGAITQAQEVGDTLAQAIASDGEDLTGGVAEDSNGMTAALIDTMLRTPHQLINYGTVIDGTTCEEAYDTSIHVEYAITPAGSAGPSSVVSEPEGGRIIVGECDENLQYVADNAGPGMVVNIVRLYPALFAFWGLSGIIMVLSMLAVLLAGWYAVKMSWQALAGIVPGAGRRGLMRSLCGAGASLGFIALQPPAVAAFMLIVSNILGSVGGPAAFFRFDMVGFLLIIAGLGLIVLWVKMRRAGLSLAGSLAQIGHQPAEGPHQVSTAMKVAHGVRSGITTAADLNRLRSGLSRPSSGPAAAESPAVTSAPPPRREARNVDARFETRASRPDAVAQVSSSSSRKALPAGPGGSPPGAGGSPDPSPSAPARLPGAPTQPAGARLKRRLRQATSLTAQVGLAVATGGGSTAVTGVKAATAATKLAKARQAVNTARAVAGTAQTAAHQIRGARHTFVAPTSGGSRPRSARNQNLRSRLRPVAYMPTGGQGVVDSSTGVNYDVVRPGAGGTEVLVPHRPRTRAR